MTRWVVGLSLLAAAGLASAQNNSERIDGILNAANDRMMIHTDVWFETGDYPRTIEMLRIQAELDFSDYDTVTNLGWMLENVEHFSEALAVYIRFREENPGNPNAAFPEGNYYFRQKAYAKVVNVIAPTIKEKPHANSYRILAHSYERMRLLKDAKRVWEDYITVAPDDAAAKANLRRIDDKLKK